MHDAFSIRSWKSPYLLCSKCFFVKFYGTCSTTNSQSWCYGMKSVWNWFCHRTDNPCVLYKLGVNIFYRQNPDVMYLTILKSHSNLEKNMDRGDDANNSKNDQFSTLMLSPVKVWCA